MKTRSRLIDCTLELVLIVGLPLSPFGSMLSEAVASSSMDASAVGNIEWPPVSEVHSKCELYVQADWCFTNVTVEYCDPCAAVFADWNVEIAGSVACSPNYWSASRTGWEGYQDACDANSVTTVSGRSIAAPEVTDGWPVNPTCMHTYKCFFEEGSGADSVSGCFFPACASDTSSCGNTDPTATRAFARAVAGGPGGPTGNCVRTHPRTELVSLGAGSVAVRTARFEEVGNNECAPVVQTAKYGTARSTERVAWRLRRNDNQAYATIEFTVQLHAFVEALANLPRACHERRDSCPSFVSWSSESEVFATSEARSSILELNSAYGLSEDSKGRWARVVELDSCLVGRWTRTI